MSSWIWGWWTACYRKRESYQPTVSEGVPHWLRCNSGLRRHHPCCVSAMLIQMAHHVVKLDGRNCLLLPGESVANPCSDWEPTNLECIAAGWHIVHESGTHICYIHVYIYIYIYIYVLFCGKCSYSTGSTQILLTARRHVLKPRLKLRCVSGKGIPFIYFSKIGYINIYIYIYIYI